MAASDLQVTATRGRVPPDVVPTVGEDSISAAQGASRRSSDALAESICSPDPGDERNDSVLGHPRTPGRAREGAGRWSAERTTKNDG